jgi:hypothetical protein
LLAREWLKHPEVHLRHLRLSSNLQIVATRNGIESRATNDPVKGDSPVKVVGRTSSPLRITFIGSSRCPDTLPERSFCILLNVCEQHGLLGRRIPNWQMGRPDWQLGHIGKRYRTQRFNYGCKAFHSLVALSNHLENLCSLVT